MNTHARCPAQTGAMAWPPQFPPTCPGWRSPGPCPGHYPASSHGVTQHEAHGGSPEAQASPARGSQLCPSRVPPSNPRPCGCPPPPTNQARGWGPRSAGPAHPGSPGRRTALLMVAPQQLLLRASGCRLRFTKRFQRVTRCGKLRLEACPPPPTRPWAVNRHGRFRCRPLSSPQTHRPSPRGGSSHFSSFPGSGGWGQPCAIPALSPVASCPGMPLPGSPPLSFPSFTLASSKRSLPVKSSSRGSS